MLKSWITLKRTNFYKKIPAFQDKKYIHFFSINIYTWTKREMSQLTDFS